MANESPLRTGAVVVAGEAAAASTIAVALVEDDTPLREGLRRILESTPGFALAGAFGSVEEALRRPVETRPQVLLLDIGLPGMSGIEGIAPLRRRFGDPAVLMFTVFMDEERIFRALCHGACGYLLKKTPPPRLLELMREAHAGGAPMSPEIAARVVKMFTRFAPLPGTEMSLTPTEQKLLALLSQGCTYAQAGESLGITSNTVRNHIRAIYEKLEVHSMSAAVSKALRAGLI